MLMSRAAILTILIASAWTTGATSAAFGAETGDIDRAKLGRLVRQDCGSCHGLTLQGGLGRALTKEALADRPADLVRDIILDGLPGTPMPPWRPLLRPEEAQAIADMLKSGDVP